MNILELSQNSRHATATHHTLRRKRRQLVRQILVVGINVKLGTEKGVPELLEGLDNAQQLFLNSRVVALSGVQLAGVEGNRLAILPDDGTELIIGSIVSMSKGWL